MSLKPVLSDEDKKKIREKLKKLCEKCWIKQGYKKTNIKSLCDEVGISIGTFYTIYPTKEDLFLETIENIQMRLSEKFFITNKSNQTKTGFSESMKELLREYVNNPILYNVNTADFQSFISKLSEESITKIKHYSFDLFKEAIDLSNLKLKIEADQAYGILSALLSTINAKDILSITCNYFEVIDFMVDNLVNAIFY